jgi:hypothetical protein
MQIQATWWLKDDVSPFLTHVHQYVPRSYTVVIAHEEVERFQEGIVGEHVDCHLAYGTSQQSLPAHGVRKGRTSMCHS